MTAPDTLPPELQELGDLLLEDPPRPDPGWVRELDARAAAGFPRPPRRSRWTAIRPILLPSLGFAATVLLVVGIATSVDTSSNDDSASSGSSSGGGASSGEASDAFMGEGRDSASRAAKPQAEDSGSDITQERRSLQPTSRDGDPGSDSRRRRKVERTAALTLSARPREVEDVADGVLRVTDAAGGYVQSSSVSGGTGGSFLLRIPSARLPRAIADLSRLAHVSERNQQTNDITAQSVSARERLREARREREGLLRALARAVTLNETDSIKARLRIVNRKIGVARAAVGRIDNRVRFANVDVTLIADRDPGGTGADDDGTWTPGDALDDAVRVLEVAAGVAVIALALALPLGLIAALGIAGGRIAGRRRRERALDMA